MRNNFIVITALALISSASVAGYDANIAGKVTHVLTYTGPNIYVRLENQPNSHPACRKDYFAIDGSLPADIRSQLLARLLLVYSTGEAVNIGYDSSGNCAHGRIRIH